MENGWPTSSGLADRAHAACVDNKIWRLTLLEMYLEAESYVVVFQPSINPVHVVCSWLVKIPKRDHGTEIIGESDSISHRKAGYVQKGS